VSLFGGAPALIAESGFAMYSTSTRVPGASGGFGIAFVTAMPWTRPARCRTGAFLGHPGPARRAGKFQTLTTPNCTLATRCALQLDYIVNEEGIENRFARHVKMRDMVPSSWRPARLQPLRQEGHRSAT
jgi:aspartate aminotransferase-like enzyme